MKCYCKTCETVTYHKQPSISDIYKKLPWNSCIICGEKRNKCMDFNFNFRLGLGYCKSCKAFTNNAKLYPSLYKWRNAIQYYHWCNCTICGEEIQDYPDGCGRPKMIIHLNDYLVYCNSCKAFTDNVEPCGSVLLANHDKIPPSLHTAENTRVRGYFWCTCGSCETVKRRFTDKIGCDDDI